MAFTLDPDQVSPVTSYEDTTLGMGCEGEPGCQAEEVTVTIPENNSLDAGLTFRILYLTIGSMGMAGNLMVLLVIFRYPHMRVSFTNRFIANQSLIDFTASFFVVISNFFRAAPPGLPKGLPERLFCLLWLTNWPLWGMFISSTYNLVALTFERYYAIMYPFHHSKNFTDRKAYLIMLGVLIMGPVFHACYSMTSSTIKNGSCTVYSEYPTEFLMSFTGIVIVIVQYFIPLSAVAFAYIRIFLVMKKSAKETNSETLRNLREARAKQVKKNVIKTLVKVFACFIACWSPNQIYYTLYNFGWQFSFTSFFYHFSVMLVFTNCCLNPIVYSLSYNQFKKAQLALFCCRHDNKEGRTDDVKLDKATSSSAVSIGTVMTSA